MSEQVAPVWFATDDELARRLRAVELELRRRDLEQLADELASVIEILDPDPAAPA